MFAKQQYRYVRFQSKQFSHIYQRTTHLFGTCYQKFLQQRITFQSSPFNRKKADPIKAAENFQETVIFIQYSALSSIQVDRFLLSSSSSRSRKAPLTFDWKSLSLERVGCERKRRLLSDVGSSPPVICKFVGW